MDADEDVEERATPTRRFTLLEITSGLPDESRKTDECEEARLVRDLQGHEKAARVVDPQSPGHAEILASDWRNASMFCARFGMTEGQFRHGAKAEEETADGPGPLLGPNEALRYNPEDGASARGQEVHGEMAIDVYASAPWTA